MRRTAGFIVVLTFASVVLAYGEPTAVGFSRCNDEAATKSGMERPARAEKSSAARATPPTSNGEPTDPSGSVIMHSPDPLIEGMSAAGAGDATYRATYRECMRRRADGHR